MIEDLDLRGIDQRHEPDPQFRSALRVRVEAIVADADLSDRPQQQASHPVVLTPLRARPASRGSGRFARGFVAIASTAAVVAAVMLVLSRQDANRPADTPIPKDVTTAPPPSVVDPTIPTVATTVPPTSVVSTTVLARSDLDPSLTEVLAPPSPDEVAQASNVAVYQVGTGHSDVTAQGRFAALRRCWGQTDYPRCKGTEGWAYVTGAADNVDLHYGLLPTTNYLLVAPLDDRLFVASGTAGSNEDPRAAPPVWLIDSITGQRGALTWHDEPVTLDSPEQELVLFPSHPQPYYDVNLGEFLPRIVDRRDWSISPLNVPSDASPMLPIHQPESDRIWVATAPEDGFIGLAYTDNGGASWTRVEFPSTMRVDSAVLSSRERFSVAASGDDVAFTKWWNASGTAPQDLLITSNAGADWVSTPLNQNEYENATELFALPDGRLVVETATDPYVQRLFVSNSASDWSQLDESTHKLAEHSHFDVNRQGIAVNYGSGNTTPEMFSTDLITWWSIPGFPSLTAG